MSLINRHVVNSNGRGSDKNRETWHAIRRTDDGQLWYQKRDKNKGTFNNGSGVLSNDDDYVSETLSLQEGSSSNIGDGSTKIFTMNFNAGTLADKLYITIDGGLTTADIDYTVSGTTLTFSVAPHSAANIVIRKVNKKYLNNVSDTFQQYRFENGDAFYFINSDGYLIRREQKRPIISEVLDSFSSYDGDSLINATTYQSAV
jgi:hypothetical protein